LLEIILWICLVVGLLFGLDFLFLWMESKGWLYYRKVKRKGSAGPAILEINSVLDPGARAAVEAREERAGEEDEDDGDDDAQRKPGDRVA
jgi:hypothetical protein